VRYTITDVAKRANVSISTVSRYIANNESVKPESARKISQAIKEMNYTPNMFAQNLKRGSSNVVGFVIPDITQDLFNQVAKILNDACFSHGYLLSIVDSNSDPAMEQKLVENLLQQNPALIVIASCGKNEVFLRQITQKHRNILLFDRVEPSVLTECVCENNEQNAYSLAKLVFKRGYHRPAVLMGVSHSAVTRFRLEGLKRAFRQFDIPYNPDWVFKDCLTVGESKDIVKTLLSLENPPDSIIYTNPKCFTGILQACWELNLKPVEDVYLAGFMSCSPSYTHNLHFPCVIQDAKVLGAALRDLMLERLKTTPTVPSCKIIAVDCKIIPGDP